MRIETEAMGRIGRADIVVAGPHTLYHIASAHRNGNSRIR